MAHYVRGGVSTLTSSLASDTGIYPVLILIPSLKLKTSRYILTRLNFGKEEEKKNFHYDHRHPPHP